MTQPPSTGGPAKAGPPAVPTPKTGPPAFAPASAHTGFLRIREPISAWKAWLLGMLPVLALLSLGGSIRLPFVIVLETSAVLVGIGFVVEALVEKRPR